MTTAAKESFDSISVSSSIVSLGVGVLCADERAKLLRSILANPETAALTKLALRVSSPAHQTASSMVSAASARRESVWSTRNLLTGACASMALVAIFSFSSLNPRTPEAGLVAMNQVRVSDHFGPSGSFEGVAASNQTQLVDRFGNGGFEAD
jgi:hypothetical protein